MRDKLLDILERSTEIMDWNHPVLKLHHDEMVVKVISYNVYDECLFSECSNVYIYAQNRKDTTIPFIIDIYKNNIYIEYDQKKLNITEFSSFYPLTDESYFQYSTLFNIHDLTLYELNLIMSISLAIKYDEM